MSAWRSRSRRSSCRASRPAAARPANPAKPVALVDDRFAKRNRHRVRARIRLELREDVADMALDRLLANEEASRHVGVRHPVREELQDLALPGREQVLAIAWEERRHERGIHVTVPPRPLLARP